MNGIPRLLFIKKKILRKVAAPEDYSKQKFVALCSMLHKHKKMANANLYNFFKSNKKETMEKIFTVPI